MTEPLNVRRFDKILLAMMRGSGRGTASVMTELSQDKMSWGGVPEASWNVETDSETVSSILVDAEWMRIRVALSSHPVEPLPWIQADCHHRAN